MAMVADGRERGRKVDGLRAGYRVIKKISRSIVFNLSDQYWVETKVRISPINIFSKVIYSTNLKT